MERHTDRRSTNRTRKRIKRRLMRTLLRRPNDPVILFVLMKLRGAS